MPQAALRALPPPLTLSAPPHTCYPHNSFEPLTGSLWHSRRGLEGRGMGASRQKSQPEADGDKEERATKRYELPTYNYAV